MFEHFWGRRALLVFAGGMMLAILVGVGSAESNPPVRRPGRSTYERTVLASRPAAYWRLGEHRGPTAHDATGHENEGRYFGSPIFGQRGAIADDPNGAVGLKGPRKRSYVEVPDHEDFSVATSGKGLTIEVWMRPDVLDFEGEETGSAHDYIHWLGKGEKGEYEWGLRFYGRLAERSNRISAYVWGPDGKLGAGAYMESKLTVGDWIYLVATYDDPRTPNAQVWLYKDGVPSPHNHSPGTLYSSYHIRPQHGKAPLRLGTRDLRSFLQGDLDEVAIYPRVLEAEEVLEHWKVATRKRR
jgi:hypothetical protein